MDATIRTSPTLTKIDADEYECGDYRLYRCDMEQPNMLGWILRFDGMLVGYPRTVADARKMIAA
jgi:hypothetical protein